MKKIISFLSIAFVFAALSSCQDPDPATAYGWTAQGQNIPGPRIIQKVEMGTQMMEEYVSNGGVVSKINSFLYDNTAVAEKREFVLTYNGSKISKMDVHITVPGSNVMQTEAFTPTYSASMMTGYTRATTTGTGTTNHTAVFSHDTSGWLTKVVEKSFYGTASMPSVEKIYNLFYTGQNVTKVERITKMLNPSNGNVISSIVDIDEYSNYDSNLTPYSTLSEDLRKLYGAYVPKSLYSLSYNNPGKYKLTNPTLPIPVEQVYTYQYDTQNYAVTNGAVRYFYKAK